MFTEGLLFNLATAATVRVHFRSLPLMCKSSMDIGSQGSFDIIEAPKLASPFYNQPSLVAFFPALNYPFSNSSSLNICTP